MKLGDDPLRAQTEATVLGCTLQQTAVLKIFENSHENIGGGGLLVFRKVPLIIIYNTLYILLKLVDI